ncbi:hypothetical protein [Endozoicomonas ascidiicola]|uniref:hypothetical protein n=1 Tax=Endozoicomonas ascidiicola TaxID=1698521 RepID=UPI000AA8BBB0|nr:hypothetical protein [Endozoicomonas ascidiicola]
MSCPQGVSTNHCGFPPRTLKGDQAPHSPSGQMTGRDCTTQAPSNNLLRRLDACLKNDSSKSAEPSGTTLQDKNIQPTNSGNFLSSSCSRGATKSDPHSVSLPANSGSGHAACHNTTTTYPEAKLSDLLANIKTFADNTIRFNTAIKAELSSTPPTGYRLTKSSGSPLSVETTSATPSLGDSGQKLIQENHTLKAGLNHLTEEREHLANQLETVQTELNETRDIAENHEKEPGDKIKNLLEHESELIYSLSKKNKTIKDLESELRTNKMEIDTLKNTNHKEGTLLSNEIADLNKSNNQPGKEVDSLRKERTTLSNENDEKKQIIKELKAEKNKLSAQLEKANESSITTKNQLDKLKKIHNENLNKNQQDLYANSQLHTKINILNTKLAKSEQEIETLTNRITDLQSNLENQGKINTELTTQIHDKKEALEAKTTNTETIEAELNSKTIELESKTKEAEEAKEKSFQLEQELRKLQLRSTEIEQEKTELTAEPETINNQNRDLAHNIQLHESEVTLDQLINSRDSLVTLQKQFSTFRKFSGVPSEVQQRFTKDIEFELTEDTTSLEVLTARVQAGEIKSRTTSEVAVCSLIELSKHYGPGLDAAVSTLNDLIDGRSSNSAEETVMQEVEVPSLMEINWDFLNNLKENEGDKSDRDRLEEFVLAQHGINLNKTDSFDNMLAELKDIIDNNLSTLTHENVDLISGGKDQPENQSSTSSVVSCI